MAHYSAKSSQPSITDKQYQEDLERATALSLESLALEKFRLQKLEQEKQKTCDKNVSRVHEERKFSHQEEVNGSRQDRFEIKSRPRPGSFNSGAPRSSRIIAPPPPVIARRNSAATATTSAAVTSSDLISFNSPSPVHEKHSTVFDEFSSETPPKARTALEQKFTTAASVQSFIAINSTVVTNSQALVPFQQFSTPRSTLSPTIQNNPLSTLPLRKFQSFPVQPVSSAVREVEAQKRFGMIEDPNFDVMKLISKKDNNNLIDFNMIDAPSLPVRVSVLESFDPLLAQQTSPNDSHAADDQESQCSSIYDVYDPFDYMSAPTKEPTEVEPVYATVIKKGSPIKETSVTDGAPPPLPPRSASMIDCQRPTLERRSSHKAKLFKNISLMKSKSLFYDADLHNFHKMVQKLRGEFPHTDACTNVGLVISPTIESSYSVDTSIKLVVHSKGADTPLSFTCDVSTTIEHVILHVICELEGDLQGEAGDYVLKVSGFAEYLSCSSSLADYDYVHQCIKLDQDVSLEIMKLDSVKRPLARTLQDDNNDIALNLEDLLPNEPVRPISYDNMMIILETLEREMERLLTAVNAAVDTTNSTGISQHFKGVWQAVKAVCALLGNVETLYLSDALDTLSSACRQFVPNSELDEYRLVLRPEIVRDDATFSEVTMRRHLDLSSSREAVALGLDRTRDAVHDLIEAYGRAFRVTFEVEPRTELSTVSRQLSEISDCLFVHVLALHRLNHAWQHQDYQVSIQVYHGPRAICHEEFCEPVIPSKSLFDRLMVNSMMVADRLPMNKLPCESRLVLVLYGRTLIPAEKENEPPRMQREEIGWSALQLFTCEGYLVQGSFLLSLWPPGADKRLGPAPRTHPQGDVHPIFSIELPDFGSKIVFPSEVEELPATMLDFSSLDEDTQEQLLVISEQDIFTNPPAEEREILWEKRHYLHGHPEALPKVLLAALSWNYSSLPYLHSLLHNWTPMEPVSALTLLLPCFPDTEVRKVAINWIRNIGCDELVDYLPQLVQALKHETWEASSLAHFLLDRALSYPRVAHHLYWLLSQVLPGSSPQNSTDNCPVDDSNICQTRYYHRLQLMLRALLAISGEAMRQRFMSQQLLVKGLGEVAENVKGCKESLRMSVLNQGLELIHHAVKDTPTCLPLRPSLEVAGVHIRSCSYFHSNTLPLKLNFLSLEPDGPLIPAICKVGDDLQQDMLTIQMIQIMDKLWLKEGLDLKMVTFACVPTGHKRGMIEMVMNAETLRKIQVELGLTGSFKDRPIAEWLAKHNPSALMYQRAVSNFTASCAGYCVATYVLGICDRHNDNIMLKTSGHMFHIDFGKFLGDAQMFGNFKRDRTPFVLTSDMAYVINGGDKPSAKFHHFIDLCCQAFNIVRRYRNLLLNLFGLMVSSGIPGVTMDAVKYVQKALLPDYSNAEAAAEFARMIESSLRNWFTQFNFFLHNLAQLQISGGHNGSELLSFIPNVYTMQREGRLKNVCVHGIQKRYDPEKRYLYIIRVDRANQPDPSYLFRSYREFCELHEKLCCQFPQATLHPLPTGIRMGRSNIKQVAEKRRLEIERFLRSLFVMADEIAHSDLIYTFFHPILRDQQEANIHARKVKESRPASRGSADGRVVGQLKLSLQYHREALLVMVHHARELPLVGGQEPSTYVKVYLRPDPAKATKRKTKVVRRSCHPTFMEMLEYRLSLNTIRQRQLEATVWSRDPLQENEFLGGVSVDLTELNLSGEPSPEWYSLGIVPRSH